MFDDRLFDPFWEEVRGLKIPVFWEIVGIPDPNNPDHLLREIERLNRWASRWPEIRGVWTHGFAPELLERMPQPLEELLAREQFTSRSCIRSTGRGRTISVPGAAPGA